MKTNKQPQNNNKEQVCLSTQLGFWSMVVWQSDLGPPWALYTSARLAPATLDLRASLCTRFFHHPELGTFMEHSMSTLPPVEEAFVSFLKLLSPARLPLLRAGG